MKTYTDSLLEDIELLTFEREAISVMGIGYKAVKHISKMDIEHISFVHNTPNNNFVAYI